MSQSKLTQGVLDLIKKESGEFTKSFKGQAGIKEKLPEKKSGGGLFGKKEPVGLKEQILGPKKEEMNPIVEAMLQSSDQPPRQKVTSARIDSEMAKYRRMRMQMEKAWYENQNELMKEDEVVNPGQALPPGGPAKGPGAPQRVNKDASMETYKRGAKN